MGRDETVELELHCHAEAGRVVLLSGDEHGAFVLKEWTARKKGFL